MSQRQRRGTSARRAWLTIAAAAAALLSAGCTRNLDLTGTEKVIRDGLATQLELEIESVSCPSDPRPLKTGDTFMCTAKPAGGGVANIEVTQSDDQGNISWNAKSSEGLFNMRKIEATVVAGLKEQGGLDATVSCGPAWKIGAIGDTFDCDVEVSDGRKAKAVITVTSLEGEVNWAVE